MTAKEIDVYNYIVFFKTVNGYSPTVREIADGVNTKSIPHIYSCIEHLADKGILHYNSKKPRTIVILKPLN